MQLMRFLLIFFIGCAFIAIGAGFSISTVGKDQKSIVFISYPKDHTLFPGNIVAPSITWEDNSQAVAWIIEIVDASKRPLLQAYSGNNQWRPGTEEWDAIKNNHSDTQLTLSIHGLPKSGSTDSVSEGSIRFTISSMDVTAPIFYRDVPLPAQHARSNLQAIEWRLGSVAEAKPRTVLSGMTECGNCHSFSADGNILGMDVDFGSDKGAYVIAEIKDHAVFEESKIMSWSDYNPEAQEPTFGLLSKVSPDGLHVVSTVNDYAVFRYIDDLDYSQMFFPVRGILVVYDRMAESFRTVPGADDPDYVQTNPEFSPDGKWLVYTRAKALQNKDIHPLMHGFISGDENYQYDLYRVPFGQDQGVLPEPVQGASHNGMSNFFPKFSPDGKWIVFCKAKRFMLNQLDSELYIIPAQGGEARRLACNFPGRMNSWHSWSPDGKWLVFASKANGPYTQLWLTHITEQGESTPPVLLDHFTEQERAANIPEFVDISYEDQLLSIINQLD